MSYDLNLVDPKTGKILELVIPHNMKGGTYKVGGDTAASLNITYNYAPIFHKVFGESGIRTIYGMTGKDSLPLLEQAINQLGDDKDDDYWKPTEGNVKEALLHLHTLAKIMQHGIWEGD